jgi:GNAT superfamily N-acetyltransferase
VVDNKPKPADVSLRPFRDGDEASLVDFLNLCYPGGWGDVERWKWLYPRCPSFERDNIFIIESNSQIIAHRGLHPRELIIQGKKLQVALLGDTATHPDYQGLGLYSSLHQATLKAARLKGACLVLTINNLGSITYRHNRKTGFVEAKASPTYVKLLNYDKIFKGELSDLIARREKSKSMLQGLQTDLYFSFGKTEFALDELLVANNSHGPERSKKGVVRIILAETSLPSLIKLAAGGRFQKVRALLYLLLSRKMKVRFSSPIALGKVIWLGIGMLRDV